MVKFFCVEFCFVRVSILIVDILIVISRKENLMVIGIYLLFLMSVGKFQYRRIE